MSVFRFAVVVALATGSLAGYAVASLSADAARTQAPSRGAQAKVPVPASLPDLRIVDMKVIPVPATDGSAVTLVVTLHNDSTSVAAGNIIIEAVHDRGVPQPLPRRHEVVYMGADELVEVSFEVPGVSMASSPYTFYAMIDVLDTIEEANESNNTNWQRVAVCGDPQGVEVADGFDNDCDGLADEGLGLSAAAADALEMLRAMQRQAAIDSVPLVYAIPRFPEGFARRRTVWLASEEGQFIVPPAPLPGPPGGAGAGAERGGEGSGGRGNRGARRGPPGALPVGELSATGTEEDPGAELTLVDWNGSDLVSGDLISLQDRDGNFFVADARRDGRLVTRTESSQSERLFRLIKLLGPGAAEPDGIIRSGDQVALLAPNGLYLQAAAGGGGPLFANRPAPSGWETFTLIFDDDGGS